MSRPKPTTPLLAGLMFASSLLSIPARWATAAQTPGAPAPTVHQAVGGEGGPVVRVETGSLRGLADDATVRFLGVPYALPPVGPLRWAAPRPPAPWEGVRDVLRPGKPAAQGPAEGPDVLDNEDCLNLNIVVPREFAGGRRRPVMVWLHGGGFSGGTANDFDPRRLVVQGDVVVVLVEFRLNVFGFFGFPGLDGSGTFGLEDQQESLRWIRRNIASFGGDPDNVTLFGESGGAIATCAQLTSPGTEGLIHRAILQSGAATTSWPRHSPNLWPHGSFWLPVSEIEKSGVELAVAMGCPEAKGSPEALHWLREQPAAKLLAHASKFGVAGFGGRVLPIDPGESLRQGRFHAVPILSGFTRDEGLAMALGLMLGKGGQAMTDEDYRGLLEKAFGDRVREVEAVYPRSRYESPTLAWSAIYTDRMFACPQLEATRLLARKAPAFAFEFADRDAPGFLPFFPGFPRGAMHSGELPFLFDCGNRPMDMTGKKVPLTEPQQALAATMVSYWTRFAWTGDPKGEGLPRWPRYDPGAERPVVQVLAPGQHGIGPSEDTSERHHCQFWSKFPD